MAKDIVPRPAGAGGRDLLAHPQELQAGHARRRPDLRQRAVAGADQEGPGARAGGQRRLPARHPARQPGHARHPLGLRLLHRRRLRHRPARGRRDLAWRRRLRHQLRRATCPLQSVLPRRQARPAAAGRGAVPQRADRRRPNRPLQIRQKGAASPARRGPAAICWAAAWRRTATSTTPRPTAGSTAPTRTASATTPSTAARSSAARSAPATISWKCRSSITSSTRRRPPSSAWKRTWSA